MNSQESTRQAQAEKLDARLAEAISIAMMPPPRLTVSEWADTYRVLSSESSAEPGKWSTSRAEYQRGMMNAVSDPDIETVVLMTCAQVGKTELINNVVGYHIHQDPHLCWWCSRRWRWRRHGRRTVWPRACVTRLS